MLRPCARQHAVISTRLYTGKTQVNVIARQFAGFAVSTRSSRRSKDAYFAAIGRHLGANGHARGPGGERRRGVSPPLRTEIVRRCRLCLRSPGSSSARA